MDFDFIQQVFSDLLKSGYNRDTLLEKYKIFKIDKEYIENNLIYFKTSNRNDDDTSDINKEDTIIRLYREQYIRSISLLSSIPNYLDEVIKRVVIDSKKNFQERYDELYVMVIEKSGCLDEEVNRELHICFHLKEFNFHCKS